MKKLNLLICLFSLLFACSACGDDDIHYGPAAFSLSQKAAASDYSGLAVYKRHHASAVKILAIGNSFTINASTFMPGMVDALNGDSICVARLTRSGCTLAQHWESHLADTPDYDFQYSDAGKWHTDGIHTIDDALSLFDWNVIVIQQQSGLSGEYDSYQPSLDCLVQLFRNSTPSAKIAWHYTWPYREGTNHGDFSRYDRDPLTMYEAILKAGDKASENLDIRIPAATLIWEMRKQYPEVEDGFSTDGYHISDDMALFALSTLWYECLAAPEAGTSSVDSPCYPESVAPDRFQRALAIIRSLTGAPEQGPSDAVDMIFD